MLRTALSRSWRRLGRHGTLVRFGGATTALEVSKMVAALIILRWVGPEDVGLWQSLLLVVNYSLLVQFGVLNGLNRELPFQLGAGRQAEAKQYASTAQAVALAGASGFLLAALIALLVAPVSLRLGLPLVLACGAMNVYRNYLIVTFRAAAAFETLAWIRVAETVLTLGLVPLAYFYGFWGLAGHFSLNLLFSMLATFVFRPIPVRPKFRLPELGELARVGALIFGFSYLFGVAHTFPRVILLAESGVKQVGLFAPVYAVVVMFRVMPEALSQYVYPQMSFRLGATGDPRSLRPMAWKTAAGVLATSAPLLIPAWLLMPVFIETFIPRYVEAIGAVRWAMFAGPLMGASIAISALFSLKAWRWVSVYTLARVGGGLFLPWLAYRMSGGTLEGMAVGFLVSQIVSFAVAMYAIHRATLATPL